MTTSIQRKRHSLPRVVTSCLGVKDTSQYWVKIALWNKTATFYFLYSFKLRWVVQMLWNCFVGFFFSLVICNLPFPGEGGLQYLGCWESQDTRSIGRCSAEIPQILFEAPVWHDCPGPGAGERCWTQAQPRCTARLPWKCSSLGIPLARSSFVCSCCAMLEPSQKLRVWKGQCGDCLSVFLGQQSHSKMQFGPVHSIPSQLFHMLVLPHFLLVFDQESHMCITQCLTHGSSFCTLNLWWESPLCPWLLVPQSLA